jgi:hypothetical protein
MSIITKGYMPWNLWKNLSGKLIKHCPECNYSPIIGTFCPKCEYEPLP